jgi:hypothetical protein
MGQLVNREASPLSPAVIEIPQASKQSYQKRGSPLRHAEPSRHCQNFEFFGLLSMECKSGFKFMAEVEAGMLLFGDVFDTLKAIVWTRSDVCHHLIQESSTLDLDDCLGLGSTTLRDLLPSFHSAVFILPSSKPF